MTASLLIKLYVAEAQLFSFENYPLYSGNDLGLSYSGAQSVFRIWAPTAEKAELRIYAEGTGGIPLEVVEMQEAEHGTWIARLKKDLRGKFYVFRVLINGKWSDEVPDPYVRAVGVNGKRGMVVNLRDTDPPGWKQDRGPVLRHPTDAVIYELHVRDASIAANSGIRQKGKFVGLTERGTKNSAGLSTGLDHLRELGITHVHLLPSFDFHSIDETRPNSQYNWGYDPLNYNVPEGSYATNPYDGRVRIREFKQLVQAFHRSGLGVILDVVYNHTALTDKSNFNQLVPGYYYRQDPRGGFSNASACGNETASERAMMRKFMIESMRYWVQEYHVDGFRVDLMGIHDIETMNLISRELRRIRPGILIYGEGWTAGASPLPDSVRALKKNAHRLNRIAVFSDEIRDGIKGHVFTPGEKGFVSGKPGTEESVKFGIVAAVRHPQVNYSRVNYSSEAYAAQPHHTVIYADCHDNHVLWDKLNLSAREAPVEHRREMHKLALSVVLASQGIAFLHAGTEFLRSKKGVENSFESPDSINAIDWDLKSRNREVMKYVRALVNMRRTHPGFRMRTAEQITRNLHFLENVPAGMIAYTINGEAVGDSWKKILVIFNGSGEDQQVTLPRGHYRSFVLNNEVSANVLTGRLRVKRYSCAILYRQ